MKTSNIGLIGLAVMGENLALNMESKGFTVSVYNRTAPGEEGVVDRFMSGRGKGKNFIGTHTIQEFVESIERPRKIMLMVKAGAPVDELMAQLIPYLSPGDVIIDGGNSDFHDTERRVKEMEAHGMYFVGTGISGGEIGALYGPSVMPGGSPAAWPLVKDVLQSIAAKLDDGTPCCQWIGPGGAGHFVKMVHNGIEYGDMQLISEAYSLLKNRLDLGSREAVDELTCRLGSDGYEVLSGPRTTGDGYYESCILGPENNLIEITGELRSLLSARCCDYWTSKLSR